jgi:ammonium transporter, Amt family
MEHGKAGTTAQDAVRRRRWSRYAVLFLATVILGSLLTPCFADEPAPDPSGTATGDRTTTTDAAGNPFVVSAPPDPSAPDYAQKKKDYDDFQAQLAKEPLAGKLADNLGHVRIATNFSWTLLTGYLVLFMQAGFALLTCGWYARKMPPI